MRIIVQDVLEYLADFPKLTREDILACLAFAADRERKLVAVPARTSRRC